MTTEEAAAKSGQLATTLTTWIFLLDDAGHRPADADLQRACDAVRAAPADGVDAAGTALSALVEEKLGNGDFDAVRDWLGELFGAGHIATDFGDDRDSRLQGARTNQFQSSLPWLAQIIDRFPDGTVGPHWVMVERITDTVHCMDPYPWDELDEEYRAPVVEFMVKWELAGCRSLRFV